MVFLSICTALYDYVPQGESELAIHEGELIYILEKGAEDDWWKAKKRAPGEEDEEPVGLIPNNYVEEAQPTYRARALYDYTRQTDEELSFTEDSALAVYDTSDPDWTLVGLNGEFGFAPANYIDISGEQSTMSPQTSERDERSTTSESVASPPQSPAAALAGIIHNQATGASPRQRQSNAPPSNINLPPRRPQYTPDASDEETPSPPPPSLPQRPLSQSLSPPLNQYASPRSPVSPGVMESPPYNRATQNFDDEQPSPGGFHLYSVNEMVSAIGKKKKLPTTLGLNVATGKIMIAPEKSRDGPQQEWTADKLSNYSIEGKHVFMDLVRPSKSIDFHAGAKDTAHEIVSALGEMAGAAKAEGLREVLAASAGTSGGQKKGHVLYDFMAQGEDEVTVAIGDEVILLDDTKSEEWWMVRRLKNGKEGVVPSSYVEVTGTAPASSSELNAGLSTVQQNRLEEERLAKEAVKGTKKRGGNAKGTEVGPGVELPKRGSSLMSDGNHVPSQRGKRNSKADAKSVSTSKPKPDQSKTRTWTDRSGSFKVDAEFIGLKDGKIHLHKLNGVKIAVPVVKMAIEDLEYVERVTGISLDEDKPLSDIRRRSTQKANGNSQKTLITPASASAPKSGASVSPQQPKQPEYDWFDFFLKTGVSPYQCERYASSFNRDSMDESVLPDITPPVLRTLGLKEGDVLRVMKYLDNKFGRTGAHSKLRNVSFSADDIANNEDGLISPNSSGGLFSGPGGALRNNTRKGRPAPAVQTDDIVDANAFKQKGTNEEAPKSRSDSILTPFISENSSEKKTIGGFDDDAWDVKPSRPAPTESRAGPSAPAPVNRTMSQPLTGSFAELSLLSPPLQPTVVAQSTGMQQQQPQPIQQHQLVQQSQQIQQPPQVQQPPQSLQQQPTGANPSFFSQIGQQNTGTQFQQQTPQQTPSQPTFNSQPSFQGQQTFQGHQQPQQNMPPPQNMPPRQRPQAPQAMQQGSSMLPPPPPRPLSAPQNVQFNSFGPPPLQPQLTGFQSQSNFQPQIAPTGQSLNDLNQMRLQQQYGQQRMQQQPTGYGQPSPSFGQFGGGIPQQTGYGQQPQLQPQPTGFQPSLPFINGQQTGSPFADPRPQQQSGGFQPLAPLPTGYQPPFQSSLQPQSTGPINSYLPPALQPQPTGANGFQGRPGFGQPPLSAPPIPHQPTLAPLQPQKTGPAPPIRFGVEGGANPLLPQPTGRKANLAQATPQNPFGF